MQQQSAEKIGVNMAISSVTGFATYGISSAMSSWAPNYDQISNLALRYISKAGYSFASGYVAGSGTNLFYQWITNDFDYTMVNFNSVHHAGLYSGAVAAGISIGFSVYDYVTWDRFSGPEKVATLNDELSADINYMSKKKYDAIFKSRIDKEPSYQDAGGFTDGYYLEAHITDFGLTSKSLAKNTVHHEGVHLRQFANNINGNSNPCEVEAYKSEAKMINSSTPSRYIKVTNSHHNSRGGVGSVYRIEFSNRLINILR